MFDWFICSAVTAQRKLPLIIFSINPFLSNTTLRSSSAGQTTHPFYNITTFPLFNTYHECLVLIVQLFILQSPRNVSILYSNFFRESNLDVYLLEKEDNFAATVMAYKDIGPDFNFNLKVSSCCSKMDKSFRLFTTTIC